MNSNTTCGVPLRSSHLLIGVIAWAALATFPARAQTAGGTPSPVQATTRPFGLNIVGPVMLAGSDAAAAAFKQDVLPGINALVNVRLNEQRPVNDAALLLDPSKLSLKTASDVRTYFVGEGAGYRNTLGFNTAGGGVTSGNPLLIFPDASSSISALGNTAGGRTGQLPLLPVDFVNLGRFAGGTKLDFFLIADGASGGRNVYSTDQSVNRDGINHVVAFTYALPNSPYLIIGFEDLYGGGDRDFNDVIFAVDIGAANIAALTATPEPVLSLSLLSLLGVVVYVKRRRDQAGVDPVPAAA